ncbi:MAG: deoxycytidine deaminase [Candidatus Aenigmarchaeota archaeon]|nr:deoxycytidine deaminase [Candidatus Aenigmarchaeota archaeon]
MSVWPGSRTARFVKQPPEVKINPNGVDVGVSEVWRIEEHARSTLHGKIRETEPPKTLVTPEGDFFVLAKGVYEVRLSNEVEIPQNAVAMLLPRSTLNRLGVIKSETAVWDSGYKGFGTQTVFVPIHSIRIHRDEKWFQLIFMDAEASGTYEGHWQNEKPVRA